MKNKKYLKILIVGLSLIILIIFSFVLELPPPVKEGVGGGLKVSLIVLDKKYETEIKEGGTVYDAMRSIESVKENNFSFKIKEYVGLGIFVEGINGVMGELGKYWIYYVNDKEASVSVSKYVLKSGDIINWKRE
ncbi:MAG: DUF4430 domain-containing protein [Candidatus Paceibacterota bacterium]|jgi:hypothetical protein